MLSYIKNGGGNFYLYLSTFFDNFATISLKFILSQYT